MLLSILNLSSGVILMPLSGGRDSHPRDQGAQSDHKQELLSQDRSNMTMFANLPDILVEEDNNVKIQ